MATTRTPEEIEAIHNRLQQKTEERKNNLKETGFAATNEELAAGEQSGIPLGYTPPSEGVQRISQPDTFIKDESDGQGGRVVTTEVKPSDDLKPIMVQKPETGRAVSLVGDESSNSSKAASSYDTTALKDTAIAVRDVATGQEVLLNRSSPPKDNLNVRNIALDGLKNKTGDNSSSQTDAEKVSSRDAQTASATDESKDLADSGENIIGLSARDDKKKDEQTTENVDSFSFNAHKMLRTPLTCSIIVTQNKKHLHQSFSNEAEYLYQTDDDDLNLGKTSLQCGRPNDALKLWTLWKSVGTNGLEQIVDHQFAMADVARDYIRNHKDYTLYSFDDSISVCFNYKNIPAKQLCTILYEQSQLMVGFGSFGDEDFVRMVTINTVLQKQDILNFFNTLETFVSKNDVVDIGV